MKLGRLASDYQPVPEAAPRTPQATDAVRRVEAAAGLAGDRERSLGEELASIEALALGEFAGSAPGSAEARAEAHAEAHELAARLAELGGHVDDLLKPQLPPGIRHPVDDSA